MVMEKDLDIIVCNFQIFLCFPLFTVTICYYLQFPLVRFSGLTYYLDPGTDRGQT